MQVQPPGFVIATRAQLEGGLPPRKPSDVEKGDNRDCVPRMRTFGLRSRFISATKRKHRLGDRLGGTADPLNFEYGKYRTVPEIISDLTGRARRINLVSCD